MTHWGLAHHYLPNRLAISLTRLQKGVVLRWTNWGLRHHYLPNRLATSLTRLQKGVVSGWTHSGLAHHLVAKVIDQKGFRPIIFIVKKVPDAANDRMTVHRT